MARAQGARAQLLMVKETVYGTAPGSGYRRIPFASTTLGLEQPLIANELLGYGRDPLAPSRDAITADGNVVIPVDAVAIGHWLSGLLGAPVTTGAGPYTHTFQSGGLTLPSYSIEKGHPDVPYFEMFSGCVVDFIEFRAERRGSLQATVGLVAQGKAEAASTGAGTPTDITLTRFGHFNASIKREGADLGSIVSMQMRYANNLDRVEVIRSDGKIDGADPGVAALSGQIVARFANTVLHDQASDGSPCELELAWEIDANTSLTLTAHAVYLPRVRNPLDGPGAVQASFDFQAAKAASPARMMTAVLVNSTASYA